MNQSNSRRLQGKVAVVTGGGRGIGEAICTLFAEHGCTVVISDINLANAEAVVARIEEAGGTACAVQTDVSRSEDCERMVQTAYDKFGTLDILINNAGVGQSVRFLDIKQEHWDAMMSVNLSGTFYACQHVIRRMLDRGAPGRIVNVSSISGQRGGTGRGVYGISKAGVEIMTKILAVEFAERGIVVNAIAPGPVSTELTRGSHSAATVSAYDNLIPMRRFGKVAEIADAALYLASSESSYVCGHVLNVDGGFIAAGCMEAPAKV